MSPCPLTPTELIDALSFGEWREEADCSFFVPSLAGVLEESVCPGFMSIVMIKVLTKSNLVERRVYFTCSPGYSLTTEGKSRQEVRVASQSRVARN